MKSLPKEFLLSSSTDYTKNLCPVPASSPPPPTPCSSAPPPTTTTTPVLSPLLCAGRPSTLAVHVFTNVSEYLIVMIPLSSALRGLSVSKAELCLHCYCYCYFGKTSREKNAVRWSILEAFFLAEVLIFKLRRTGFRVDVWNFRDGGKGVFFIRHWLMPTLWW